MSGLLGAIISQSITFMPLALGITISYYILRATDMTIDGSFVLGAGVFARLLTLGYSPELAALVALVGGGLAGVMVSLIQRGGKIDPLLAGVLATFILTSVNLLLMGRPNISLLNQQTMFSTAFDQSNAYGYLQVAFVSFVLCIIAARLIQTKFGLTLRALGSNPDLLKRLGRNIELYRMMGFALTNMLAAAAGCLTAQTIGYADVGMGFGMTLTGIGAIIIGKQLLMAIIHKPYFRIGFESLACLTGVLVYYFFLNGLLRAGVNPVYLKMLIGLVLVFFIRTAVAPGRAS